MDALALDAPTDAHLHLRDGRALTHTVPEAARWFERAVVMPNLDPPVRTVDEAMAYRRRILAALPADVAFEPMMTLYLTEATTSAELERAAGSPHVFGAKLYPAGATTGSEAGVADPDRLRPALRAMEAADLPLLVHAEAPRPDLDLFDREAAFLEDWLGPMLDERPGLRVVVEHVSSERAVDFVRGARAGVAATVTAHHLLLTRNDLLAGGLRPHRYCMPVVKRERDRRALVEAATSGDPRFLLGTDSAPHPRAAKEGGRAAAGIYTAPLALALYAEAFEQAGALDRLAGFASDHAVSFYGLPRPTRGALRLVRRTERVPEELPLGADRVVPLRAGTRVAWWVEGGARPGAPSLQAEGELGNGESSTDR